jgi:methylmalonyl-CoA mutase cobalamin-binding subunit
MVLGQHHMVGFKVLRSFYANCGYSVQTSAKCKTDRSAVLMVMSDLDPHMIDKLKDEINHGLVKLDELGVV